MIREAVVVDVQEGVGEECPQLGVLSDPEAGQLKSMGFVCRPHTH